MKRLLTLFFTVMLTGLWLTGAAQTADTVRVLDHVQSCYDVNSIAKSVEGAEGGLPGGSWGPAESPLSAGDTVVITHQIVRVNVPADAPANAVLRGVYVAIDPEFSAINGEADEYAVQIFGFNIPGEYQFGNLDPRGLQTFTLEDADTTDRPWPFDGAEADLLSFCKWVEFDTPIAVTAGEEIAIAVQVNGGDNDDVLNFYHTFSEIEPGQNCPSAWHVLHVDAETGDPVGDLPLWNDFFALEGGEPELGGNPFFIPEYIYEEPADDCEITLNLVSLLNEQCPEGADGFIEIEATATGAEDPIVYVYEWIDEQSGLPVGGDEPTLIAPAPGDYTVFVTVQDQLDCPEVSQTFTVEDDRDDFEAPSISAAGPVQGPPYPALFVDDPQPEYTYQWRQNGADVNGETTELFQTIEPGTYSVEVTFGECTDVSNNIIITESSDDVLCLGECTTLEAAQGGAAYFWSPATAMDNRESQAVTVCPRRNTEYTVRIDNGDGTFAFDTFNVVVVARPTASISPDGPTEFCEGGSVTLEAVESASYSYQWFFNGDAVEAPEGAASSLVASATGVYQVEVTNQGACPRRSLGTFVQVIDGPDFGISGYRGICSDGFTTLEVTGGTVVNRYTWAPETGLTISPSGRTVRAEPNATTTYTVSTTNASGCTTEKEVTVEVSDPIPSEFIDLGNNNIICTNLETLEFTVGPPTGMLTVDPEIAFSRVGTDSLGQAVFEISPRDLTPGSYEFTWTGNFNGCDFTTSETIEVIEGPEVDIENAQDVVCELSASITLNPIPAGGTLSINEDAPAGLLTGNVFDPSAAELGVTYTLTYEGVDGPCEYMIEREITVIAEDQIAEIEGIGNPVCSNIGAQQLRASVPGGVFGSEPTGGSYITPEGVFDPEAALEELGGNSAIAVITYTGTVGQCTIDGRKNITVNNATPTFEGLEDAYCTDSECDTITVTPTGGTFTPNNILRAININQGLYEFCPQDFPAGTYTFGYEGTNNNCPFSVSRSIEVNNPPAIVQIVGLQDVYCTSDDATAITGIPSADPEDITFTATNRNGDEGGITGEGPFFFDPAQVVFLNDTDPTVSITVTYEVNAGGCVVSTDQEIIVIRSEEVVFEVDGDTIFNVDEPVLTCTDVDSHLVRITPVGGQYETTIPDTAFQLLNEDQGIYVFYPGLAGAGEYTLLYSGNVGLCDYLEGITIRVDTPPAVVDITGLDGQICSTEDSLDIQGIPTGGAFVNSEWVRDLGDGENGRFYPNRIPNFTPEDDVLVTYEGQQGGCRYSVTKSPDDFNIVLVYPAIIGLPAEVCSGVDSLPLVGNPNGLEVETSQWTGLEGNNWVVDLGVTGGVFLVNDAFEANGEGDYIINYAGTTVEGCEFSVSDTLAIVIGDGSAEITGLEDAYCLNAETVQLSASPEGGRFRSLTEPNAVVENEFRVGTAGVGQHIIEYVYSEFGCDFTTRDTTNIFSAPNAELASINNDVVICTDEDGNVDNPVVFVAQPADSVFAYAWYYDPTAADGITLGDLQAGEVDTTLTVTETGYYSVIITDTTGCADTSQAKFVNVFTNTLEFAAGEEAIVATPPTGCNDDGKIFIEINDEFGGGTTSYNFYINGDGPFSQGGNFIEISKENDPDNPSFALSGGEYCITVEDARGCQIDTCLTIVSNCCPEIENLVIANPEVTNGSATVAWDPITPAETIRGFEIEVREDDNIVQTARLDSLQSSYDLDNLQQGVTYCVRVRSICEEGARYSEWAEECFTLVLECPAVTSITVTDITASSAVVTWETIEEAVSYDVTWTEIGSGMTMDTNVVAQNSVLLEGLTPGASYDVTVSSNCGAGETGNPVADQFSTSTLCEGVTSFTIDNITTTSANVNWEAVPGAVAYRVRWVLSNGTDTLSVETSDLSVALDSLQCGASYVVDVAVICGENSISNAVVDLFSTLECCGPVDNIVVSNISISTATVTWTGPENALEYAITVTDLNSGEIIVEEEVTGTTYDISGLQLGGSYDVSVRTICADDESDLVSEQFSTSDICESISSLEVLTVTPTTGEIQWIEVPGALGYLVEWQLDGATEWESQEVAPEMTTYVISNLTPGQNYNVRVSVICSDEVISDPVSDSFTTPSNCPAPENIQVEILGPTSVRISWNSAGATQYIVRYRATAGDGSWNQESTSALNIVLSGLDANTEYEYQIRSICGQADFSEFTDSDFFTTPQGLPCGTPTGITNNERTATTARIFWDAVGNATDYEVNWALQGTGNWNSQQRPLNFVELTGLTPDTEYDFRVRSICGEGDFSGWSNIIEFRTSPSRLGDSDAPAFNAVSVYPNPNRGEFTVSFTTATSGDATLLINDVAGKAVLAKTITFVEGKNDIAVNLRDELSAGMYLLQVRAGEANRVVKIIVE